MKGRKPSVSNVVPLTGAAKVDKNERPRRAKAMWAAYRMRPRGLSADLRREWMRVGVILADPALDRLKPHFVDTVVEYCQATIRLRDIRQFFIDLQETRRLKKQFEAPIHTQIGEIACEHPLAAEVYEVQGRNGAQLKSHPLVAQMNEAWRQWRSLMMELGLSPSAERNMIPGQGNLFDDPAGEFYG